MPSSSNRASDTGDSSTSPRKMEYTREELMEGIRVNKSEWNVIEPDLWHSPISPTSNATHLTTFVARAIQNYDFERLYDDDVFYAFREEFETWNKDMFDTVYMPFRRELKIFLRFHGVYTGRNNGRIGQQLAHMIQLEEAPEWNEDELRTAKFDTQSRAFEKQQALLRSSPKMSEKKREPNEQDPQSDKPILPVKQQPPPSPHVQPENKQDNVHQPMNWPIGSSEPQLPPREGTTLPSQTTPFPPPPPQQSWSRAPYAPYPVQMQYMPQPNLPSYDPYSTLPPRPVPNARLDPSISSQFVKTFDRKKKYTGEPYDLLEDKLRMFFNICYHAEIRPEQFHAVFPRILTGRAEAYYLHYINRDDTFAAAYEKIKTHFDTEVNHHYYYTDWTSTTFNKMRQESTEKNMHKVLQTLLDKLQLCQRALGPDYAGEANLRTAVIKACRGVPELEHALFKPAKLCEELFSDMRSSIETHMSRVSTQQMMMDDAEDGQYYLDRRYNNSRRGRGNFRGGSRRDDPREQSRGGRRDVRPRDWKKKCFVCHKEGCWSTKHTDEERRKSRNAYVAHCNFTGTTIDDFATYLTDYEGHEMNQQLPQDEKSDDDEEYDESDTFLVETCQYLTNQAFLHQLTGEDVFRTNNSDVPATQFMIQDRYSKMRFQGILPDTGAARVSTAGKEQYLALQREDPSVQMDESTAGQASIRFGKGSTTTSIGTVTIETPIGTTKFHVLDTPTPFLLCLADMDRLGVYFNNTTDELIRGKKTIPVIRKWGHPWFFLSKTENAGVFLSEIELRRLHRRFGHPATNRLYQLLEKAGHDDVDKGTLEMIAKSCHHCQMHSTAPRRFKFTLKDDHEFNYEILVDVMYLNNRPVLHVVDSATAFQGARFLPSMSAKDTWEVLRSLWIDTYQGPPDIITHDAGTNFASTEFHNEAKVLGISCKQAPVEAHWSIGKLERYHSPLRRAFEILSTELGSSTTVEAILQMAVKAVNDTAGPDGLVPTLLVFGAYPRMTLDSPPSPSTLKRSDAIQKAMKVLRKVAAERQVNDALNTRNGPSTTDVLALPLQSEVRVWREKDGWQGPYKIAATDGHNVTLDMVNGPATFRSTLLQPYYRGAATDPIPSSSNHDQDGETEQPQGQHDPQPEPPRPRKRGRPPGSKNKPKRTNDAFLSTKEKNDRDLAVKLRNDGVITTPGAPFEESDTKEIDDLIGRGVFSFELYDPVHHGKHRIFKSRMVREIKGKTEKPYEKSRLVIQGYKDKAKETILTQSPTIQRASQRLLLALAPSLMKMGMTLTLRDITQAYPQAQTDLFRVVLADLPAELKQKYPENTIIRVIKPLYGIAEAGVHWFATYQGHHTSELDMSTSTFDPCLMITNHGPTTFGMIGMQTDDTLILATPAFSTTEEEKIQKAQFRSKPKTLLSPETPLDFNGAKLTLEDEIVVLKQKGQGTKIDLIDTRATDRAQRYVEQRARGAYIASICQPDASFDLSVAAQAQNPDEAECEKLNNRLKWQMGNIQRGLRYVPIDLTTAKLMVFTDGSFANNKDLSSQIGFILTLVTETARTDNQFDIRGNLIHWSSTKCKRVTRSVLASEIYGMVNGFDVGLSIATTVRMITDRLGLPAIPLVVCTDSFSLYECLVKLGTTKEKRLMIDIMALRQSYERREIAEIRWINGKDNPSDAMTKASPNRALERFVNDNELTIRMEGFVQRTME